MDAPNSTANLFDAGIAELAIFLCMAFLVDAVIGHKAFFNFHTNPRRFLTKIANWSAAKLNRNKRSPRALLIRGFLSSALLTVIAGAVGIGLDHLLLQGTSFTTFIYVLLLAQLVGQKKYWARLNTQLADKSSTDLRLATEQIVLAVGERLFPTSLLFLVGGMGAVFAFLMVQAIVTTAAPRALARPQSPYFVCAIFLYDVITLIPASLSSLFLLVAAQLQQLAERRPTYPAPLKSVLLPLKNCLFARSAPLNAIAFSYNIQMEIRAKSKDWAGPKDGQVQLDAKTAKAVAACCLLCSAGYLLMLAGLTSLAV